MGYATVAGLRTILNIGDTVDDDTLSLAIEAASSWIDDTTGGGFTVPTAATVRTFPATDSHTLRLPAGLANTTGLVVATDDNDDGVYETTWTIGTDFVLGQPVDTTWPTTTLIAVGSKHWPLNTRRPAVSVTGRFGWAAVPAPISYATLLLAKDLWKDREMVGGVAGFGEFGAVRTRANPVVQQLLGRYRSGGIQIGIGSTDVYVRPL